MPWLDGAKDTSDQLKFIQRCSEGAAAGTAFLYALLSGGEIVGMVSFNNIEKLISLKDDSPFVFAGLWEGWKDPANGEWLHTGRSCVRKNTPLKSTF
jgi:putative SOS response-associated peptidase YedK